MPGLFGAVGLPLELAPALRAEFAAAYGAVESVEVGGGILGGHAFGTKHALQRTADGTPFAVDGEPSVYRPGESLFRLSSGELVLDAACKGNVATVDPAAGAWHVATEWTGSFPLYYALTDGGFVFSSRIVPLARILGAAPDPIGIVEFVLRAYRCAGRTDFQGIRRLVPGQVLRYEPQAHRLHVRETSRLWADVDPAETVEHVAARTWEALETALGRSLAGDGPHALMMSGGWDSRTLFAAELARLGADRLVAYSHGDLESREMQLVERLCRATGVSLRREPLDDGMYDLDRLRAGFARAESVMFPHWHRAGALLADAGIGTVSSGVYGEVLGGHYGPAMVLRGNRKITAVAGGLLRRSSNGAVTARALLRFKRTHRPWHVAEDVWAGVPSFKDAMNADVETALQRLEERGVRTNEELVEAFITEHRGTQYIDAQMLSMRARLDVVLPYTDRDVLAVSTRAPVRVKIHNGVNREILRRHAPELARLPCSAALLPASAPLLAQEVTRLVRKRFEDARWKLHFATRGRVGPPRLGWGNFEFLRSGKALGAIADDLHAEFWDRDAIKKRVAGITRVERGGAVIPLTFLLMRIYTVELTLRAARAPAPPAA